MASAEDPPATGGDRAADAAAASVHSIPLAVLQKIFGLLGPRDLVMTSITCRAWASLLEDAASNQQWHRLFLMRWSPPAVAPASDGGKQGGWRLAYRDKMDALSSWEGSFKRDLLHGHRTGVKALKLCPSLNLLVTGSADKTVRLWELSSGSALACSFKHGGTVRSVAVDKQLVVSGSSDSTIRYWRAWPDSPQGRSPFVVTGEQPTKLSGTDAHTGPVTCLGLTERYLYSGSWDMTVRLWQRWPEERKLVGCGVWNYGDWVWDLAIRGPKLFVAAGRDATVQDLATGQLLTTIPDMYDGSGASLEATYSGQLAFTGGRNGQVLMHDLRTAPRKQGCMLLWQGACNTAITSLSLEDPWLALASSDGSAGLLDLSDVTRMALRTPTFPRTKGAAACRRKTLGGGMQPVHAIDIVDRWVACGNDSDVIRTWNAGHSSGSRHSSANGQGKRWQHKAKPGKGKMSASSRRQGSVTTPGGSAESRARASVPSLPAQNAASQSICQSLPAAEAPAAVQGSPAGELPHDRMQTWAILKRPNANRPGEPL